MGQQQLLLIVLGVILVGLAITVGISAATTSAEQANRDAIMSDLITLTAMARNHYLRPEALRGGGYSFRNFNIPAKMDTTEHGIFSKVKTDHDSDHMHFQGVGTELGKNGTDPIQIEVRITFDEFRIIEHN